MSLNLIELVKGQLGDTVLDQLGGMLGESVDNTRNAVDAGVPTILGSIVDKVTNDSNAGGMLSGVLDDLDDGIADDFTSFLQPDKQTSLAEKGGDLLSGLFGDNMGGVVDMISKFSGIGNKSSSSLLGMVLPLILGFISKQRTSNGLDQDGVLSLLGSQKDHISQSMPSGMSDLLGQSGILSGLTGMLSDGAQNIVDAASDAVSGVTDTVADVASNAQDAVGDVVSGVTDTAEDMASSAKDVASDVVEDVGNLASDAAGAVGDVASNVVGSVKDTADNVVEGADNIASGAADAVGDAASAAKDTASNVTSAAADGAGQVASAGSSMIRKILPIAAVVLVVLFLLKNCM